MIRIAVIGAGMAGVSVSSSLASCAEVSVFEKSRGPGGRMSTRYTGDFQFDHGAPFFTARSSEFREFLQPFIADGTVRQWQPDIVTLGDHTAINDQGSQEPRYVAAPKMNSLCHALKDNDRLYLNTRITAVGYEHRQWYLHNQDNSIHGPFDYLITTIPGPQVAALVPTAFAEHARLDACRMHSCYSLMLGFDKALDLDWQVAKVEGSPVEWIIVDSAKPGRGQAYALLVHSSREWARVHIDDERDTVQSILLQELHRLLPAPLPEPDFLQLHSWLYAGGGMSNETTYLFDHRLQLGACGDWMINGDVESAFLSARALADEIKARIITA